MLRLSIPILLCFAVLTGNAQEDAFRVMSYNIRLPVESDGINYWNHRRPLVASMITYHSPDIIGVQEAFRRQLDEMTADHPEYAWTGVCRNDGTTTPNPDGEFSAIFFRKDRFEKLDGNTFWLSPTPDVPGSKGWDAAITRIVTWAKFRDKTSGKEFYFFNTHFDHIGETARFESAKLILQKINTIAGDQPVLLSGDFNSPESTPPYQWITKNAGDDILIDGFYTSRTPHHGPNGSFSGTFTLPGVGDYRIDFVFVNRYFTVLKHAILSDSWDGRLPSDHLPVLVEVYLKE